MRDGVLTVILPAYNEEENIVPAAAAIGKVLSEAAIPYELLFVDDGSSDHTWEKIRALSESNDNVRGIHFSRNFGKESAVFAGLANMKTACCAVMDCDLQHPAEVLPEMYGLWKNGIDVVEGIKKKRGTEERTKRGGAFWFYKLMGRAAGFELEGTSDFKLLDKEVVTVIKHLPERNTFFRAMSFWVGFPSASVEYEVQDRTAGESKWSVVKLVRYAMDNLASFTTAPMQIVTGLGIIMFLVGLVFGVIAIIQKISGAALGGFTTVILLEIFTGAVIMISLGIIGFYVSRIYREVQHRPRFLISDSCGLNEEDVVKAR